MIFLVSLLRRQLIQSDISILSLCGAPEAGRINCAPGAQPQYHELSAQEERPPAANLQITKYQNNKWDDDVM